MALAGVGGQAVLSEIYRWRVQESEQIGDAALLGQLQEPSLSGLLVPVVSAVRVEETIGAGAEIDLAAVSLLHAAGADVEAPDAQAYSLGIPIGVCVGTEQQIGHGVLCGLRHLADKAHALGVRCAESVDGLIDFVRIDHDGFLSGCNAQTACREK